MPNHYTLPCGLLVYDLEDVEKWEEECRQYQIERQQQHQRYYQQRRQFERLQFERQLRHMEGGPHA